MLLKIKDYDDFVSSIYHYIIESYGIIPRDFEGAYDRDSYDTAIQYDTLSGRLVPYLCSQQHCALHTHENDLIYCTEVEILAARYVYRSVFHKRKRDILLELKSWLPMATLCAVNIVLNDDDICDSVYSITSDLAPAYCVNFFYIPYVARTKLIYNFISNIVTDNFESEYTVKETDRTIMVRRRSRSRSRSRSASPCPTKRRRSGRRRRSRSRSRSRSSSCRARSPPVRRTGKRRRSRSRSRSR